MKILRGAELPVLPWKNGGGVSLQLAAHPADAGYDTLEWQVARPTIAASGPFSHLPGLDRQFMLVAGSGVELRLRGDGADFVRRVDVPLEPFAFRGDWDVDCRLLDGPVEVLNVMTRRGRAAAVVATEELSDVPTLLRKPSGEVLVAYCPLGPVTAYGLWGTAQLEHDDAVLVDETAATEIALASADTAPLRCVTIRLSRS